MTSPTRQPVLCVPHGGGPWPFVDMGGFLSKPDVARLREFFTRLPDTLPEPPGALLVISAHWEERAPTVTTSKSPPIYYDYYGFPPESYAITWPAPGDPELAHRVMALLEEAGIEAREDAERGFDHGTFIPFKLSWPEATIPTIQLSLKAGLDPALHLEIGRALAPLRDEGVLILASGMTYHNMRGFRGNEVVKEQARRFDAWLHEVMSEDEAERARRLTRWEEAPHARQVHPREEHLLPLMVAVGASGGDAAQVTFDEEWMGVKLSAFRFG